jgi:modification methylase
VTAREAPRVAFASLIERGMIKPGETVFDAKRKVTALVRAEGALQLGAAVGSIHRIGAVAQGAGACNGWAYWHVERNKKLMLIDELRAEVRSTMGVAAE